MRRDETSRGESSAARFGATEWGEETTAQQATVGEGTREDELDDQTARGLTRRQATGEQNEVRASSAGIDIITAYLDNPFSGIRPSTTRSENVLQGETLV